MKRSNLLRCHSARVVAIALFAATVSHTAPAGDATANGIDKLALEALAKVVAIDRVSLADVDYCVKAAPSSLASDVRAKWQAWRKAYDIPAAEQSLARVLPASRTQSTMDAVMRKEHERLARLGAPEAVCRDLAGQWSKPAMNLRKQLPDAYNADASVKSLTAASARNVAPDPSRAAASPTAPPAPSPAPPPAAAHATSTAAAAAQAAPAAEPAAPVRATVYSVAQLTALIDSWRGRNVDESRAAMRAAGVIHIRGKVVRRRDSWFVEHDAGDFGARMSVSPGINVSAHDGAEIVIAGRFDDWPGSLAFMRDARIVTNTSKLEPAKLDERAGLFRKAVDAARVRTEPGKGVSPGDIEAVMHGFEHRAGGGSSEPVTILLDDGWAYRRTDVPPEDLNVKASRELEPQLWGRWRKKGKDYEFQAQDDWGQARPEWTPVKGRPVPPWPKGQRLAASYEHRSFYGSIGFGGTSFHNVIGFEKDGRFRSSDSSLSSSGSLAANDAFNPTSTTSSSHSDSKGTSTTVSHSNRNETLGTNIGAHGKGKRDDGADRRGTYTLSGYVLETRTDSGQVVRSFSFPWNDKYESAYMRGRTFGAVKPEPTRKP